jgi:hypothetical protein
MFSMASKDTQMSFILCLSHLRLQMKGILMFMTHSPHDFHAHSNNALHLLASGCFSLDDFDG